MKIQRLCKNVRKQSSFYIDMFPYCIRVLSNVHHRPISIFSLESRTPATGIDLVLLVPSIDYTYIGRRSRRSCGDTVLCVFPDPSQDLIEMVIQLQSNLRDESKQRTELEEYLDKLLLRVMETSQKITD
eukprot:XP_016661980.1 PREDICTED: uncharacterized protein LOC107884441 [Acyrthosiphon pisum]